MHNWILKPSKTRLWVYLIPIALIALLICFLILPIMSTILILIGLVFIILGVKFMRYFWWGLLLGPALIFIGLIL